MKFHYWRRYYVLPSGNLRRAAWRIIAGLDQPNPADAIIEFYRLGAWPIGYADGEFVVYVPEAK